MLVVSHSNVYSYMHSLPLVVSPAGGRSETWEQTILKVVWGLVETVLQL